MSFKLKPINFNQHSQGASDIPHDQSYSAINTQGNQAMVLNLYKPTLPCSTFKQQIAYLDVGLQGCNAVRARSNTLPPSPVPNMLCSHLPTNLHGVTTLKTNTDIFTDVTTSNLGQTIHHTDQEPLLVLQSELCRLSAPNSLKYDKLFRGGWLRLKTTAINWQTQIWFHIVSRHFQMFQNSKSAYTRLILCHGYGLQMCTNCEKNVASANSGDQHRSYHCTIRNWYGNMYWKKAQPTWPARRLF
jgi:hypothetical protein